MQSHYDLSLVLASYVVAVAASYCALDLGGRIAFFSGHRQRLWLMTGALAMGTGVWSMHFLGMQALRLPTALTYDLALTVLSWLAATAVSLLALYAISRSQLTATGIAGGGVLMGLGICVMHHSGMYALRMTPQIGYDLPLLMLSTLIAMGASAAALLIGFTVRRLPDGRVMPVKIGAALVMGAAICGMHYTGMSAAQFADGAVCAPGNALAGSWLGGPLAAAAVALLIAIVALLRFDARSQARRELIVRERAEAATAQLQLQLQRRRDPLSGLADATALEQAVSQLLTTARTGSPISFGIVRAALRDHRMLIERLGHTRVDEVVQTLAAGLSSLAGPDECVTRASADTFALLVVARPNRTLAAAINEVATVLGTAVLIRGQAHRFSWELSSRRYPDHGDSPQALLLAAGGERQWPMQAPARPAPLCALA